MPAVTSEANASCTVVSTTDSVCPRRPDVPDTSGALATESGIRGTSARYGRVVEAARRHGQPFSHARTAFAVHADGSVVSTLWPTPGTTSRCPCGNCETTEAAFDVGVRMSNVPDSASTGTSGSGPAAIGAFPSGDGQTTQ